MNLLLIGAVVLAIAARLWTLYRYFDTSVAAIWIFKKKKSAGDLFIITGASNAGKTVLFTQVGEQSLLLFNLSQLVHGCAVETMTSSKPNIGSFEVNVGTKARKALITFH